MTFVRGDIVAVAGSGDFAGKPRPALVVQSDLFNALYPSVSVCPISSTLTEERLYRVVMVKDELNGLKWDSEVEVDKVQAVWRRRVGGRIGQASQTVMIHVDDALRRWLDL